MREDEAKKLRAAWKAKSGQPCKHRHLALESGDSGYLTGNYFCTKCGQLIMRDKKK